MRRYFDKIVPIEATVKKYFDKEKRASYETKELLVKEANIHIIIKFIGYMVKHILKYRENMFQYEDFKKSVKGLDHIIILTQHEKKVR